MTSARSTDKRQLFVPDFADQGAASVWPRIITWFDRAEVTRHYLEFRGISSGRFSRIEGVADREPYVPSDRFDPRNRRISITLGWRSAGDN